MSDPGLRFPVIALSRDTSILTVNDWPTLTSCSAYAWHRGYFTNLQVIDSALRRFAVHKGEVLGGARALRIALGFVWHVHVRVDLSFSPPTQLTLEQATHAVIRGVNQNRSFWEESGPIEAFSSRLSKASSFDELASPFADA